MCVKNDTLCSIIQLKKLNLLACVYTLRLSVNMQMKQPKFWQRIYQIAPPTLMAPQHCVRHIYNQCCRHQHSQTSHPQYPTTPGPSQFLNHHYPYHSPRPPSHRLPPPLDVHYPQTLLPQTPTILDTSPLLQSATHRPPQIFSQIKQKAKLG